jgi:hypothetical protein
MYNGSTILLCVTIFVIHKQCFYKGSLFYSHCGVIWIDEEGIILFFKGYSCKFLNSLFSREHGVLRRL